MRKDWHEKQSIIEAVIIRVSHLEFSFLFRYWKSSISALICSSFSFIFCIPIIKVTYSPEDISQNTSAHIFLKSVKPRCTVSYNSLDDDITYFVVNWSFREIFDKNNKKNIRLLHKTICNTGFPILKRRFSEPSGIQVTVRLISFYKFESYYIHWKKSIQR